MPKIRPKKRLFYKIRSYILRSWEDEPGYTHPRLRILPPFILELLAYFIGVAILYKLYSYIFL